ncbi:MAG: DegQ family serine endoprotease [Magnetococcus sp. DMHC-6]
MYRSFKWLFLFVSISILPFSLAMARSGFGLPDLTDLVKDLKPVVVNISTTQKEVVKGVGPKMNPFGGDSQLDEFFRRFFEQLPEQQLKSRSLGSGVIIDDDGYILTNNHVVEDASEILVRLSDEREFSAKLVGRDVKTDLALIRIDAHAKLPKANLGDSDKAEVGSWVVAIGNPFGLEATVTAGIISARGRIIGSGPYDNFLQTDAAINPGNSGGPLFNLDGEVIGINTAIFSRSGGSMGIGFAIPVNMAKTIVGQLKEHGHVTRGWLGVRIQLVTPELAQALGLGDRQGALVASVEAKSPAAQAGVMPGDVIINFNHKPVGRMNELPTLVAATRVGERVPMVIIRNGKQLEVTVVIAQLEEKNRSSISDDEKQGGEDGVRLLGLDVRGLTPAWRERLNLDDAINGVVVADVDETGAGREAGIRTGDVISEINRKSIQSLADFDKATQGLNKGQTLLMLIIREGDPLFLALQIK